MLSTGFFLNLEPLIKETWVKSSGHLVHWLGWEGILQKHWKSLPRGLLKEEVTAHRVFLFQNGKGIGVEKHRTRLEALSIVFHWGWWLSLGQSIMFFSLWVNPVNMEEIFFYIKLNHQVSETLASVSLAACFQPTNKPLGEDHTSILGAALTKGSQISIVQCGSLPSPKHLCFCSNRPQRVGTELADNTKLFWEIQPSTPSLIKIGKLFSYSKL